MKPDGLLGRAARRSRKDPYEGLPVDELDEPILPRWFVMTLLVSIPVAVVVFVVAFFFAAGGDTPLAERRPPPDGGLTSAVGAMETGDREPVAHDPACPAVDGFWVAGTELDRATLAQGLDLLCDAPADVRARVAEFAATGPVMRFAAFEKTGVDVTGDDDTVFVNARFSRTPPSVIGPLVAYQAVVTAGDASEAATILGARRIEFEACDALVDERSRPCDDAADLLALQDPLAALEDAGFR